MPVTSFLDYLVSVKHGSVLWGRDGGMKKGEENDDEEAGEEEQQ